MEELNKLLLDIKERYGLYIGKKSLDRLTTFINGYMHCMFMRDGDCPPFLPNFQEFIADRYGIQSSHHWSSIIQFHSIYEEDAFDQFYELLDEFSKTTYPQCDFLPSKWVSKEPDIFFTAPNWLYLYNFETNGEVKTKEGSFSIAVQFKYDFSEMSIFQQESPNEFTLLFSGKSSFEPERIILKVEEEHPDFNGKYKEIVFERRDVE